MSWLGRFNNLFRRARLDDEIEKELVSHIQEAIAHGRSAKEAQKRLGRALRFREESRDIKMLPWLDSLASDTVFGWRQLRKRPAVSAAAILSLALAIGATMAAFRLINAVLLRTLPVTDARHLFFLAANYLDRDSRPDYRDEFDYPTFRRYREVAADRADLMVAGMAARRDAVFGSGAEIERIYRQYVSGNLFGVFGLQPALGRLLAPDDDLVPGARPVAVLSYDYWTHRFGRDPNVLGTTFRMGTDRFEIIGIAPKGFIGTEPGAVTDVFIPAMMNTDAINSPGWSWFRIWVHLKTGFSPEQVRQPLQSAFMHDHRERLKRFQSDTPKPVIDAYLSEKLVLLSAASGASDVQRQYRRPLLILAALVALVLLIASTNVGNLLTAQATSRSREMALRVSIGAGQWRLIQLVLVESALMAAIASALGTLFAAWAPAPLVVAMLHVPEDPVRLVLDAGWLNLAFSIALASLVVLLFGLAPALRASNVKPISALRGGEDPHARDRWMKALLAAQMAFCVLVLFVAGLFVSTFQRLSNRPLGFSSEHILVMDTSATKEQPPAVWMQVADQLRGTPGVQSVALAGWPLLSRNRWTTEVRLPGHTVEIRSPYVLDVSPGFFDTMSIGAIDGRDFRPGDVPPRLSSSAQPLPGAGIVNEAFARVYFRGQNPVGRSVEVRVSKDLSAPMEIVGYVRDAAYYDVREAMHPTMYVAMGNRRENTFLVRTAGDPLALASILRRAISSARSDFRVSTVQPQSNFFRWQMLRERLLATLSLFFAVGPLLLAAIGLYGVLNYSVTWQRREIGIRMALGARPAQVVRQVTTSLLGMVALGLSIGLAGGMACGRFVESLLFGVKATDAGTVTMALLTLLAAALVAALPPAIRAAKIDPAQTLRSE